MRSLALDYLASVAEQIQRGTEFRLSSYHYSSQGRTLSSPELWPSRQNKLLGGGSAFKKKEVSHHLRADLEEIDHVILV